MSKQNILYVAKVRTDKDKNGKPIPIYRARHEKPKRGPAPSEIKRITL